MNNAKSTRKATYVLTILILLFSNIHSASNALLAEEENNRIVSLNHHRDFSTDSEVLQFNVRSVGSYRNHIKDLSNMDDVEKIPECTVIPLIGTRFASNPDRLFYLAVPPDFSTGEKIVGHDKNKRPIFSTDYKISANLFDFNKGGNTVYGIGGQDYKDVSNAKLPEISNPDLVQIVVFVSFKDVEDGKYIKVISVPAPGKAGITDSVDLSGNVVPGGIIFTLMFLAFGLSGAAAGAAGASKTPGSQTTDDTNDTGKTNDELSEKPDDYQELKEQPENAFIDIEVDTNVLIAGKSKLLRLTAIPRGVSENMVEIINNVSVSVSGPAKDHIHIEELSSGQYKSYEISFTYKRDSEFYAGDKDLNFPQNVLLNITAPVKVTPTQIPITLEAPKPEIHLNQKTLIMPENSNKHPKLKAWVVSVEEGDWDFSAHVAANLEIAVNKVSCKKTSSRECEINLASTAIDEDAGSSISSEIQILASNNKTGSSAEITFTVTVAKEGLVLISPTPIRIAADGESETEIEITAIKARDGKLTTDFDTLLDLSFTKELTAVSETAAHAFQTSRLEFYPQDYGQSCNDCWRNLDRSEGSQISSFVFRVKTSRFLPGQGESYYATGCISDKSGENKLAIPLMLDVDLMQAESKAWEIELERCRKIIAKLPESHQKKLNKLLNERSRFLGAKGLYVLRKRIWTMGQTLWEAEGLSGYEDVERWAGYIENTLNFAHWAGRMATDFLLTNKLKMGVFSAMAAGEIYDLIVSSINAYKEGKSFDEWLEESFWKEIRDMLVEVGAAALEPDKFVQKFSNNKKVIAIAWSIQFAYHFIANLTVHKLSVIDAVKKAAMTVATAAALKFLAHKAAALAKKKGIKPEQVNKLDDNLDDAAEKGWQQGKSKVDDFDNAIKSGDKRAIKKKLLEIQSDKFALKEINKWPAEVRAAYNKEMGKLYASIDKRVKKKIIQDLRKQGIHVSNKNLKMTNATNASKTIKVGSDRDISVEYTFIDKKGRTITLEYPREKLKDVYGRELYRSIGYKNTGDMLPDELMEKYDQYALDSKDAEAYGKKRMNYENGKVENKDFNTVINNGSSPGKLQDGTQIGMTAAHKGKHWFNKAADTAKTGNLIEAESFKMEGMSQLVKQFKNIYKPRRDLLDSMGKRMADDSTMRKLIEQMEKAVNLEKSPSYVEKLVKSSGFSSMNEFADAFGGSISAMNSMME